MPAIDRLRAGTVRAPEPEPAELPRTGAPVRTDPVRATVDIPPHHHTRLEAWLAEQSQALGLPVGRNGVQQRNVLEHLLAVLLTDETVARRVAASIAKDPEILARQRAQRAKRKKAS